MLLTSFFSIRLIIAGHVYHHICDYTNIVFTLESAIFWTFHFKSQIITHFMEVSSTSSATSWCRQHFQDNFCEQKTFFRFGTVIIQQRTYSISVA